MQPQSQTVTVNGDRPHEHRFCGLVDDVRYHVQTKQEARTKPQPWILLKTMVFMTVGIMAYTAYVYIGRFCAPYIKGRYNRRAVGIVLLIIFVILYCWMLWSYSRIVFTSPGYARDYVSPTPQPRQLPTTLKPFDDMQLQEQMTERRFSHITEPSVSTPAGTRSSRTDSVGGPSYEDINMRTGMDRGSHVQAQPEPSAGVMDSLPRPAISASPTQRKLRKFFRPTGLSYSKPKTYITRRPPSNAVLLPEHRYCSKDGIVKPYRTHHCRHCGTCVLRYDHHCPWIGQCVGARNHKFFLNFTEAACIFCIYVFVTVLGFEVHDIVVNNANIDPQLIVIIVLGGVFGLFTSALTISHIWLILKNQTTVENMVIRRMKELESVRLDKAFSFFDFRSKKHMRKEWDREWGNLESEGHIWWVTDKRAAWEDVMGKSVWGWFFPVSRGLNNGLSYPVNPRFDSDGRWRRRSEWPSELQ